MVAPLHDASTPAFHDLLETCPIVLGATVSKPLLNLPEAKIVVFAMDEGQEMRDHRAPFIATVHVLDGRLRFGVDADEKVMGPNDWLLMPANTTHHLTAIEPTRFVLTLIKAASPPAHA